MRFLAIAFACAVLTGGCVYRIDVQQGNYVTQDVAAKLKTGMSRTEVRQLLGTPLLSDVFHNDRWDYYFSHSKGAKGGGERKVFSVFFKDDKVESFTGDVQPPAPPPVGGPPPTVTR